MTLIICLPKVHFGFGVVGALRDELKELGISRPLMMTDQGLVNCGVLDKVLNAFQGKPDFPIFDQTPENPTVEGVEKAHALYVQEGCDGVVAVGGGSVIDASKAVAGYDLTISGNEIKNNVEGIGIRIVSESSPVINGGNQITNNEIGIRVIGSIVESVLTNPQVTGNSIYGNTRLPNCQRMLQGRHSDAAHGSMPVQSN